MTSRKLFFLLFICSIYIAIVIAGEPGEGSTDKHEQNVQINIKHALIEETEKDIQQKQVELFKKLYELQMRKNEKADMERKFGIKIEKKLNVEQIAEKEKSIETRFALIGGLNLLNLEQIREWKNAIKPKENTQIPPQTSDDQRGKRVATQMRRRLAHAPHSMMSGSLAPHPTALGIQIEPQTPATAPSEEGQVPSDETSQSSFSPLMHGILRGSTLRQEFQGLQHQQHPVALQQQSSFVPISSIFVEHPGSGHDQIRTQAELKEFTITIIARTGNPVKCNVKLYKVLSEDWSTTAPGRFELVGETDEHGVATFDAESVKADFGELLAIEIGHVKMRKMFKYTGKNIEVHFIEGYLVEEKGTMDIVPSIIQLLIPLQVFIVWEDSEKNDFLKNNEIKGFRVRVYRPDLHDKTKTMENGINVYRNTVSYMVTQVASVDLPAGGVADGMELAVKVNVSLNKGSNDMNSVTKFFHYHKGMQQITFPYGYDHTEIKGEGKRTNSEASGSSSIKTTSKKRKTNVKKIMNQTGSFHGTHSDDAQPAANDEDFLNLTNFGHFE